MKKNPINAEELGPQVRINGFDEVVFGYSEEQAIQEAARCLQCKKPTCILGCPVNIDIKKFIFHVTRKDYQAAYLTIRETNNFPNICGRVCPAEYQCRKACVLNKNETAFASVDAINIHFLERFVGDYGMKEVDLKAPVAAVSRGQNKKVAVVGSGPAGLCCAGELARAGVDVVMFEGLHKLGGVLRYGIPSFRLPQNVLDFEILCLERMGVQFVSNCLIGKTKLLKELFDEGFSAVFLGLGAGIPAFLGISGENLCNVYSANEFLTRVNLMQAYKFPEFQTPVNIGKHIVVIGGGNTAIDAARVAIRLQKMNGFKPDTTIFYRRTEIEMPARRLEIGHAKDEGIRFEFLVQPQEFSALDNGFVKGLRSLRCELGQLDKTGRPRPIPIEHSSFTQECDMAVIAIGLKANQLLINTQPDLKVNQEGDLVVDQKTMHTSMDRVYAGGDIVGGEGTVIEAFGMAKRAAKSILQCLMNKT